MTPISNVEIVIGPLTTPSIQLLPHSHNPNLFPSPPLSPPWTQLQTSGLDLCGYTPWRGICPDKVHLLPAQREPTGQIKRVHFFCAQKERRYYYIGFGSNSSRPTPDPSLYDTGRFTIIQCSIVY